MSPPVRKNAAPKKGFVLGALVLSLSGFLSKLCGAVFKIPLTNLVGAEAMGYFGSAYSIYNLLLSLATAGIPTGISTMIARSVAQKKYRDIRTLLWIALSVFVTFGAVLSLTGILFSRQLAAFMNSDDAYYCVLAIMPAVFFISIVAIFRGFFQGHNNMVPTALSNIIEASMKLVAGYGIAYILHCQGYGAPVVVGGAMAGVTLGTLISAIFMLIRYFTRGVTYRLSVGEYLHDDATPRGELTRQFLLITIPIMISSVTANLMSAVDSFLVVNCMKSYVGESMANVRWGAYSSMALTLFNLPSFLIIAIGTSLVPSISMAYARRDHGEIRTTLDAALKYSAILAFGCGFGLSAVSQGAVDLFYFSQSAQVRGIAATLLSIVSFALICVGFSNVTASILQSVGKSHLSVVSVAVGALIKTASTYLLVRVPEININGAPIATNISYPIILLINALFIRKYLGYSPRFSEVLLKPLICAAGCYVSVWGFNRLVPSLSGVRWAVFPQILVGGFVYIALIFGTKLLTVCEIRKILRKS